MSKHTPGPWSWKDDIQLVVLQEQYPMAKPIAVVTDYPAEAFANARLLAAAPELLTVLQEFVTEIEAAYPPVKTLNDDTYQHAKATLAKATGETV